jgi:hypothetical protein
MASGKSDYLENGLLNHIFNGASMTSPGATLYVSAHTAAVADDGSGAEVSTSGTAYAREAVTKNTTNFPTTSTGTISNGTAITFDVATGNWGTVTSIGIWDAITAGNLLYWGDLTASQTVNTGNQFSIPAGDLDISEA